jgi:DNA-binding winged helix-turn-helix (wHTH) protein
MASFRFGSCLLDIDARQLYRDGQAVRLSPKAFELLRILLTERGKAVSKAQLHERIWPGTFVTDDSLARLVTEARAAIGDHARAPEFLLTMHAHGYRFDKAVETKTTPPAPPGPAGWIMVDGRQIQLFEGENIIGRDLAAQVFLDSVRVSRQHARVVIHDGAAEIEDVGSRNGTSLRGAKIASHTRIPLEDGDEISIGGFTLKFRRPSEPVETVEDTVTTRKT